MADNQEAEVSQQDLFDLLEKTDVKVADDAAEKMKENILNDKGGTNYLGIGIHDVSLTSIELVQAKTGTIGVQFNVGNSEGQGRDRMWLSDGALPYTIENVSRLVVHNAEEAKKDAARTIMSNIVSAKELYTIMQQILDTLEKKKTPFVGHLFIREAKNGGTYTDKNGVERPSLETSFLSYRPKETLVQSAIAATGGTLSVDKDLLAGLPF